MINYHNVKKSKKIQKKMQKQCPKLQLSINTTPKHKNPWNSIAN